jgi:hypothetical protein
LESESFLLVILFGCCCSLQWRLEIVRQHFPTPYMQ